MGVLKPISINFIVLKQKVVYLQFMIQKFYLYMVQKVQDHYPNKSIILKGEEWEVLQVEYLMLSTRSLQQCDLSI